MIESKKKILVVSSPLKSVRDRLLPFLSGTRHYDYLHLSVEQLFDHPRLDSNFDACVFDCESLDQLQLATVLLLRALVGPAPIIVLTQQIAIEAYRQVDLMQEIHALQKSFGPKMFWSLLERVTDDEFGSVAPCARFVTDEPARITIERSGMQLATRLRNLSPGGAFLEYHGVSLAVGDSVQMTLSETPTSGKVVQFHRKARVSRLCPGDHYMSIARGVEVEFA